jgi:hypothetical protein
MGPISINTILRSSLLRNILFIGKESLYLY